MLFESDLRYHAVLIAEGALALKPLGARSLYGIIDIRYNPTVSVLEASIK
jgi:hypothetical protein